MVTRIIYSEFSPRIESIMGRSWSRVGAMGLGFVFAGMFVLTFPRLIATLIALGLFLTAGTILVTAYHLWQMNKAEPEAEIID